MRALSTHGTTNDVGRVMHLTTVPEHAARIKQPQHSKASGDKASRIDLCTYS